MSVFGICDQCITRPGDVITRPSDVIAGGAGGVGQCPLQQHQPPGK